MTVDKHIVNRANGLRAQRLAQITALVQRVWKDEVSAQRFLKTEHPELGNRKPIDVAQTDHGVQQVEAVLRRDLSSTPG